MAEAEIKIVLNAQDNSGQSFSKVDKSLNGIAERAKSMQATFTKMAAIGTGAFVALSVAVGKSVKAFQEQERAEARLEQLLGNVSAVALKSSGAFNDLADYNQKLEESVKGSMQALKEQAAALQQVGVIGDEVTIFGQSQLATFALQTDAIKTLTPAMLDMAVATKGVNATQQDMIDIGNMLGKVMGGQVGALSRVGVVFNDAQGEILKTGTEMEKAAALAEILDQNFGGLNEKARETSEGAMKALQNSFGDLQETIGAAFVPILNSLAQKLLPIIERFAAWVQENPKLVKILIIVTGAISALVAVLGFLGLVLPVIATGFALITLPVLAVVAAVAAFAALAFLIIKNWEQIKEFLVGIWTAVRDFIVGIVEKIKDHFISRFDMIKNAFIVVATIIKNTFRGVINNMISMVEGFVNFFILGINGIIAGLNKIQISIPDWVPKIGGKSFGVNIPKVPEVNLPRLAKGGIVTSPTIAEIGEAGPEAVIPLDKLNGMTGGGITVNITGNSFMGEEDMAERVGDKIISLLKLHSKLT